MKNLLFFRLIATMLVIVSCLSCIAYADQSEVTIHDLSGKDVTVKVPVEKMVLQSSGSGGPFFTLFALEGKDAIKKIAGIDTGLEVNRYDIWEKFVQAVPELKNIPKIGDSTDINVESVVTLKPDVLVVPKSTYTGAIDNYKKIEEAGIPVVVIDYHAEKLESHEQSMKIMGQLLGKEKRAEELFNDYKTQMNIVNDKLDKITSEKPRVYVECAGKSPEEIYNTYPNDSMWGALVQMCRGDNIADGIITKSGPMNLEAILKKDPQVIIYTGSYWPKEPKSFRLGFTATEQSAKEGLASYAGREGWNALSAVKNNRVYGIYHGISRDIFDFAAFQFVAKALYPDEFKDVNPDENLKQFFSKYLPVELSGVWMLGPSSS